MQVLEARFLLTVSSAASAATNWSQKSSSAESVERPGSRVPSPPPCKARSRRSGRCSKGSAEQSPWPRKTLARHLLASPQADLDPDTVDETEESSADLVRRLAEADSSSEVNPDKEVPETAETETALVKSTDAVTWSSAAKARDFFEQLAPSRNKGAFA